MQLLPWLMIILEKANELHPAWHSSLQWYCHRLCPSSFAHRVRSDALCDAQVSEAADCLQRLARKAECRPLRRIHRRLLCALPAEQYEFGFGGIHGQPPLLTVLLQQVELALQAVC